MNLPYRIDLLARLGEYILSEEPEWMAARETAFHHNGWFTPRFIDHACRQIAENFLKKEALLHWVSSYPSLKGERPSSPPDIGIVMAGNIPLVGFHDWLCCFVSGYHSVIKLSKKDSVLLKHLVEKLNQWSPEAGQLSSFAEMLKGCDAYIATGSNNSSRYFSYYFQKYPHIIRRSRTSVAILDGNETMDELSLLADDVFIYFGLGCRNVTKLYLPEKYDFVPLLEAFKKYSWIEDHHKYKNNYDYTLALHILNKQFYMTNGAVLLIEDHSLFSRISQLNYEFIPAGGTPADVFELKDDIQCVVGHGYLPFGQTQEPELSDYADGIDTMKFLAGL
jgi:hypothetical protein